ncbi:31963_t:CDS:2, partial [Gigaspora margarita]
YRNCYLDWMGEEVKKLTPTGRIQRPAYNLVAQWIKTAWDQVDPALIKRSFKCYSISTAQDGSEEDFMFNYNWVKNPDSQNKNSNSMYIDTDDISDGESVVDLTHNDDSDSNYSNDSLNQNNSNEDSLNEGSSSNSNMPFEPDEDYCEDTYYSDEIVDYVN